MALLYCLGQLNKDQLKLEKQDTDYVSCILEHSSKGAAMSNNVFAMWHSAVTRHNMVDFSLALLMNLNPAQGISKASNLININAISVFWATNHNYFSWLA